MSRSTHGKRDISGAAESVQTSRASKTAGSLHETRSAFLRPACFPPASFPAALSSRARSLTDMARTSSVKKMWFVTIGLLALGFAGACSSSPTVNSGGGGGNQTDPDGSVISTAPQGDGGGATDGVISIPPVATTGPGVCTRDAGCDDELPELDAGPACGDGRIDEGEECDDGNADLGDGCSGACRIEPNFKCEKPGEPCTSTIRCGNGKLEEIGRAHV